MKTKLKKCFLKINLFMRFQNKKTILICCLLTVTTFGHGVLLYKVTSIDADRVSQTLGFSQVTITNNDINIITQFNQIPGFLSLSSYVSSIRINEHFHYTESTIQLNGKLTADTGQEIPEINNEASIKFKASQYSSPENGAQANPGYQIHFQVNSGQISALTSDYRTMNGFPFRISTDPHLPISEKVFSSMLMLLYNDNLATTGSNIEPFVETVTIQRIHRNGQIQLITMHTVGKKYLVLSRNNQYLLTTWVTPSMQYGIPAGTVVAFEYQRMGDPVIHLSLLLFVNEEEREEQYSQHREIINSQQLFKKTHRRAYSGSSFDIARIQGHLRSHSQDFQKAHNNHYRSALDMFNPIKQGLVTLPALSGEASF